MRGRRHRKCGRTHAALKATAEGDIVRITANGRDATGQHRLDNGRIDTIRGFTPGGDIVLSNRWVMGKDFAHLKQGVVSTSPASQSNTEDITLQ